MALGIDVLSNISDALQDQFIQELSVQYNTCTPLLAVLAKKPFAGKKINFDAEFDGITGVGVTKEAYGYVTGDFTSNDFKRAYIDWAIYSEPIAISDHEVSVADSSQEPEQLAYDIIARRMKAGISKLALTIESDLYTGLGATASSPFPVGTGTSNVQSIVGLTPGWVNGVSVPGAITSDTGTYAGISRTSYAAWKGNFGGLTSSTVLTPDLIDGEITKIYQRSGTRPNLIVVSPKVAQAYRSLLSTIGTTPIFNLQNPRGGSFDPMVSFTRDVLGHTGLSYAGIPILEDWKIAEDDGTLGKMYFLNTNYMHIAQLPYASGVGFAGSQLKSETLFGGFGNAEASEKDLVLKAVVKPLASSGLYSAWALATNVQLVVTKPQAMSYMNFIKV